jgi:GT2 family glycosyltransferase
MVEVSAIVSTYNNEWTIEKCLSCLISNRIQEIVVVDGGSKDKTLELVSRHSEIRIIRGIRGIGKAREMGWRASRGKYVLFLDADAYVQHDHAFEQLQRHFSLPKIAGVTCRVACANPNKLLARLRDFDFRLTYPEEFKQSGIMDCVCAPTLCGLFRREALEDVNGFDMRYFYGEDLQLLYELQSKGYRVLTVYDPAVFHYHRESLRDLCVEFYHHGLGCRMLVKEKGFYRHKNLRRLIRPVLKNASALGKDFFSYPFYRALIEASFLLGYSLGE